MSSKKKFLKPVGLAVAALLAGSSFPASALTLSGAEPVDNGLEVTVSSAGISTEPLFVQPADNVKAEYGDAYHYSHSSHSSHASHMSSSY